MHFILGIKIQLASLEIRLPSPPPLLHSHTIPCQDIIQRGHPCECKQFVTLTRVYASTLSAFEIVALPPHRFHFYRPFLIPQPPPSPHPRPHPHSQS